MGMTNWLMTPKGLAMDRLFVKYLGVSPLNHAFARQAGFRARPALLLETIGRKSGARRSVALPYFELDNRLFVVGSKGGAPEDPFWVQNLRANGDITMLKRRKRIPIHAQVLTGDARTPIWDAICQLAPVYAGYQENTERQIPVIELSGRA